MKDIVEKLDKYAHGHEKNDFEGFDHIYNQVISGELILELSDIVLLCRIFNKKFEHIEPHQYCDIQEMTIVTMNNYDLCDAFKELIKGLDLIFSNAKEHVEEYIVMLFDNYDDEELKIFAEQINPNEKQNFVQILHEIKLERQDYTEEIELILKTITE
nr:hypothetical protein [uncultured Cellulosilyticum sp.]